MTLAALCCVSARAAGDLRWGPWQGDPRGRTPRHPAAHATTRHRRSSVPQSRGEGAAGGASCPREGGHGAPVGAAGELAAPAGGPVDS